MTTPLHQLIEDACLAEAAAPKPGNVHPGASFQDLSFDAFRHAAYVTAPALASCSTGVGASILNACRRVEAATATNVNLGICLLIAPLAAVKDADWPAVDNVLDGLTVADAAAAYEAIRLANPGGLGRVENADVAAEPTVTLLEAMELAAGHDLIARIYAERFEPILGVGQEMLRDELAASPPASAIVRFSLRWQADYPDTHIARRCGSDVAQDASRRAADVLAGKTSIDEFDVWLRADGHRRNPGTTADVVAATLFVLMRSDAAVARRISAWIDEIDARWPR